jgi:hypothetical protein
MLGRHACTMLLIIPWRPTHSCPEKDIHGGGIDGACRIYRSVEKSQGTSAQSVKGTRGPESLFRTSQHRERKDAIHISQKF